MKAKLCIEIDLKAETITAEEADVVAEDVEIVVGALPKVNTCTVTDWVDP